MRCRGLCLRRETVSRGSGRDEGIFHSLLDARKDQVLHEAVSFFAVHCSASSAGVSVVESVECKFHASAGTLSYLENRRYVHHQLLLNCFFGTRLPFP